METGNSKLEGRETRALIGLGSNLGDRLGRLRGAVDALAAEPGIALLAASTVLESPPMGPVEQGPFYNAAALIATGLDPRALLDCLLRIERDAGRVREVRWGPRTLDLDLLWMEGVEVDEDGLVVPHPGLAERPFVLRPVAELLPELVLPDGRTARQAVEELGDDGCIPVPGAKLLG